MSNNQNYIPLGRIRHKSFVNCFCADLTIDLQVAFDPSRFLEFEFSGVINIGVPIRGIRVNIFRNRVPFAFMADDVVVVIALPDFCALTAAQFVDLFGYGRFVRANDCAERIRFGSVRL